MALDSLGWWGSSRFRHVELFGTAIGWQRLPILESGGPPHGLCRMNNHHRRILKGALKAVRVIPVLVGTENADDEGKGSMAWPEEGQENLGRYFLKPHT